MLHKPTSRIKVRLWVAASWIRKLNAGGLYVDWSGLIPWKNSETMESRRLDWSEIYEGILVTRQYYISSMILHRAQRTSFQSSRKIIPNPSFFFLAWFSFGHYLPPITKFKIQIFGRVREVKNTTMTRLWVDTLSHHPRSIAPHPSILSTRREVVAHHRVCEQSPSEHTEK